ncbi:DUF1146 family protein [Paenibacillus filicis]|uniref:DUF1146 family protein n=1 Tax=Paenibacillus gyeongsangnamensis TaxID=3388067 RepID=A0ABT4QD86_9BACL|nr:DUF1146 family protein [Paenibacillus filicis]MCZ8514841.1 DUF1146 family protein [Paenibacillus filicis]
MDYTDQLNASMGLSGLLNIVVVIVCIGLSWWALQELKLDAIIKRPRSPQGKALQIFLSVALGYQLAKFVLDYFHWSTWLHGMF